MRKEMYNPAEGKKMQEAGNNGSDHEKKTSANPEVTFHGEGIESVFKNMSLADLSQLKTNRKKPTEKKPRGKIAVHAEGKKKKELENNKREEKAKEKKENIDQTRKQEDPEPKHSQEISAVRGKEREQTPIENPPQEENQKPQFEDAMKIRSGEQEKSISRIEEWGDLRTGDVTRPEGSKKWEDMNLDKRVLDALTSLNHLWPSPIQEESFAPFMEGRDIVARAKNGTGKTAAYMIPLLHKVDPNKDFLQALILVPTRELALQTSKRCKELAKYITGLKILPLYGGVSTKDDIIRVKEGIHILVGTPGRVLDFAKKGVFDTSKCNCLVFDEADKLLGLAFMKSIHSIIYHLPAEKHFSMYSATFPSCLEEFINQNMNNPLQINLMTELFLLGVKQYYSFVARKMKLHCLKTLLSRLKFTQCFIFCNSALCAELLAKRITEIGFTAYFIHSGMEQDERNMVFHNFTQGVCKILVSTDLTTRGVDVPAVDLVINFDFPISTESYLHRVGRGGRFGGRGMSISLVTDDDKEKLEAVETELGSEIHPVSEEIFVCK